jgi:hypothetical protein
MTEGMHVLGLRDVVMKRSNERRTLSLTVPLVASREAWYIVRSWDREAVSRPSTPLFGLLSPACNEHRNRGNEAERSHAVAPPGKNGSNRPMKESLSWQTLR